MAEVGTGFASVAETVEVGKIKAGAVGEEFVVFVVHVVFGPSYLLGSSTDCSFRTVRQG